MTFTTTSGGRISIEASEETAKKLIKKYFPTLKIKEDENRTNNLP